MVDHDGGPASREGGLLRIAHEADLDALTEVWERAARSTHGFMGDEDFAEARPYVRDHLLPSMDVWLAEDVEGTPVGFVGARGSHVEMLYIEPSQHGTGLGTRLLDRVGEDGPTSVEVYAGNTHGLGFYESRGFHRVRTHTTDAFGRPFPVIHLQRDPGR